MTHVRTVAARTTTWPLQFTLTDTWRIALESHCASD
jgi:hypothetical protein